MVLICWLIVHSRIPLEVGKICISDKAQKPSAREEGVHCVSGEPFCTISDFDNLANIGLGNPSDDTFI